MSLQRSEACLYSVSVRKGILWLVCQLMNLSQGDPGLPSSAGMQTAPSPSECMQDMVIVPSAGLAATLPKPLGPGLSPNNSFGPSLGGRSVDLSGLSSGSGPLMGSTPRPTKVDPVGVSDSPTPNYFVTEPADSPPSLGVQSSPNHSSSFNSVELGLKVSASSPAQGSFHNSGLDLCLSRNFMDLSLKRKAVHEDLPTVRHPKLLKWDGLDESIDKVEMQFSLGAQSKVVRKEKKARSSGRKVGRPRTAQLVDVVVGTSQSDMPVFSCGSISVTPLDSLPEDCCSQAVTIVSAHTSVYLVKDVITPTLKDWDHRKISNLVSSEEHDAIARIPISMEDKVDALIWHYNSTGSYTVKSGYQAQLTAEENCKPLLCHVIWICWSIWKARNAYIFNHEPVDPVHVIARANWEESAFLAAQSSPPEHSGVANRVRSSSVSRWNPPARGLLKINCDAAYHPMSSKGAIAVLLRDDRGRLVDGLAREVALSSASQGEALALRLACIMVSSLGLSSVEVEGDNSRVIHLCVSEDAPPWQFGTVITDIKSVARQCNLSFSWCARTANEAAHWTAQACLGGYLPCNWISFPPAALLAVL
ncbi:hypothetical protein LOK49_LG15G01490 [Camellia lanceoleosa]|uniref:Uncharacterized protein n=1 Tax=Camellia lanceoleosa TaxID=1840588 RepID=A0ACC0F2U6_9ERIC|nr:hypothetical protein LOK49_LG15G01490 [Camellia lanceoleosa]